MSKVAWTSFAAAMLLAGLCASAQAARPRAMEDMISNVSTSIDAEETSYSEQPEEMPKSKPSADAPFVEPSCCESCDDCGCDSFCRCCPCGPPGNFWIRSEYLGFWAKGGSTPVLAATSPNGTLPATVPLYGGQTYNDGYRSGNWTQGGMWFDCCRQWGVQGDYFFLGRDSSPFSASSDTNAVITRPFIDANTGAPAEELVSYPGVVIGRLDIENYNSYAGAGGALRHNLCCWNDCCQQACDDCCGPRFDNCCRLDFLAGFRYYKFSDNLNIRENLTYIDPLGPSPVGTQYAVQDTFRTLNNFYGAELGLIGTRYRGRFMTEGQVRVALGTTQQVTYINGSTVISFPGQPTAVNEGGILALQSNIGRYTHNNFTAIPMFSGRVGYRVTERFTVMAGYTLIYWNNVARAGDQIDTTVNPNLIPPVTGGGPNRPEYNLHLSDTWLQGITLGGELYF